MIYEKQGTPHSALLGGTESSYSKHEGYIGLPKKYTTGVCSARVLKTDEPIEVDGVTYYGQRSGKVAFYITPEEAEEWLGKIREANEKIRMDTQKRAAKGRGSNENKNTR